MNLCHPDSSKSCAACCGLYNVVDARRQVLNSMLTARTLAFRNISRDIDEISDFGLSSRPSLSSLQVDPDIHVCEYAGFLDDSYCRVGCMLHPDFQENNGIDFRGLCFYGSMACKGFFCPASAETEGKYSGLVNDLVSDWHLYGLLAVDISYLNALFGLLEMMLDGCVDTGLLMRQRPAKLLSRTFAWKTSWPFGEKSSKRRSAYYFKRSDQAVDEAGLVRSVVDSLCFTFDILVNTKEASDWVRLGIRELVESYKKEMLI